MIILTSLLVSASVPLHHSTHVLPQSWNDPDVEKVINTALDVRTELHRKTKTNTWEFNATVIANEEKFTTLSVRYK